MDSFGSECCVDYLKIRTAVKSGMISRTFPATYLTILGSDMIPLPSLAWKTLAWPDDVDLDDDPVAPLDDL